MVFVITKSLELGRNRAQAKSTPSGFQVEVFHAIRDLMSSTVRKEESTDSDTLDAPALMRLPSIGDVPNLVRSQSAGLLLEEHVSSIIAGVLTQLKTSQSKTKSGAFSVLRELIIVRNGGLNAYVSRLFVFV